jgi:hypothetical protein
MASTSDTEQRQRWEDLRRRAQQALARAQEGRRRAEAAHAWAEMMLLDAAEQHRAVREIWQHLQAMRTNNLLDPPDAPGS